MIPADEVGRLREELSHSNEALGSFAYDWTYKWKPLLAAAKDVVDNPEEYAPSGDTEHHARLKTLRKRVAECELSVQRLFV